MICSKATNSSLRLNGYTPRFPTSLSLCDRLEPASQLAPADTVNSLRPRSTRFSLSSLLSVSSMCAPPATALLSILVSFSVVSHFVWILSRFTTPSPSRAQLYPHEELSSFGTVSCPPTTPFSSFSTRTNPSVSCKTCTLKLCPADPGHPAPSRQPSTRPDKQERKRQHNPNQ